MRIVLTIIAFFFFAINIGNADELRIDKDVQFQKNIIETGFRILNSNNIEKRITFYYVSDNKLKTKINTRCKTIYVYKGIFPVIDNENELAAILSTDIAKLLDSHAGFFRRFSISFSPRKYEVKSDKKAVDLMVKAGYDPVALINIINKTAAEKSWFEYNIFHHNGSERVKYIYQYIYEKYPVYLAENQYLDTAYYQNFLRTTRSERRKVRKIQEQKIKNEKKETLRHF